MGLLDAVVEALGGGSDTDSNDADSDDAGDEDNALRYDGPPTDARRLSPEVLEGKADLAAEKWDDYDLDFTVESLARLDEMARERGESLDAGETMEDGGVVATTRTGPVLETGSYFGEVLVRRLDAEWTWEDRWTVTVFGDAVSGSVPVFDVATQSLLNEPSFAETAGELSAGVSRPADREEFRDAAAAGVEMAAKAAELARKWESYDLDFSPASLERLDDLVDSEFRQRGFRDVPLYDGDNPDSMVLTVRSLEAGGYLAEVFRRNVGGQWRDDEGFYFVVEGSKDAVDIEPVRAAAECFRGIGSFRRLFEIVTKSASTAAGEDRAEDWEWEGSWQQTPTDAGSADAGSPATTHEDSSTADDEKASETTNDDSDHLRPSE